MTTEALFWAMVNAIGKGQTWLILEVEENGLDEFIVGLS
jgi:hypothetical protein